jgi:hypothetical protein
VWAGRFSALGTVSVPPESSQRVWTDRHVEQQSKTIIKLDADLAFRWTKSVITAPPSLLDAGSPQQSIPSIRPDAKGLNA